jgi:hypothetical protein
MMWSIFIGLKKAQLSTDEIPSYTRQKLKPYGDLFILNTSSTSWHQWRRKPNMKIKQLFYQKWSWSACSELRHPISDRQSTGSPIGNQNLSGLMMCSWASYDTLIFFLNQGSTEDQRSGSQNSPWRYWAQQVAYEESDRNSRITPSRITYGIR